MSGPGTSDPPALEGITRNSALSFLAQARCPAAPESGSAAAGAGGNPNLPLPEPPVPPGVKELLEICSGVYPDQPNPLQVTTRLKYWLGGSDPLDYISMYWHNGDPALNVPPHWHYISFGLTDLHGDGRVHPPPRAPPSTAPSPAPAPPSGLGMELTLRVSAAAVGAAPPLWPAALMQALARYIVFTGNAISPGDHITWHSSIDGANSRLTHLLAAQDPTLPSTSRVQFVQLVGCTKRELRAAQRGSAPDVLKALKEDPKCGGRWLVTVPSRVRSVRVPPLAPAPAASPRASPLAGLAAPVAWTVQLDDERSQELSQTAEEEIKRALRRGLDSMADSHTEQEGHMSTDSFEMSSIERALPHVPGLNQPWPAVVYLRSVHVTLTREGASLLPLAIDGRIRMGRQFTFRGARHVTLIPTCTVADTRAAGTLADMSCSSIRSSTARGVTATGVKSSMNSDRGTNMRDEEATFVLSGDWLQIIIPPDLAADMSSSLAPLALLSDDTDSASETEDAERERDKHIPSLPITYEWPRHRLKITVVEDGLIL